MNDKNIKFNQDCRIADITRWRSLDFVVGYEIHLSNNPDSKCTICKHLQGKYPKTFQWHGWCDKCRCYATPVLMDEETRNANEQAELKAALTGKSFTPQIAKNQIEYLPTSFINWLMANCSSWKGKEAPYFVKENQELITAYFTHGNQGK